MLFRSVPLCVGYAVSQIAYFGGKHVAYARWVDQPAVRTASGLILLAAIVFALVREGTAEAGEL